MITIWPDNEDCTNFYYEMKKEEGALIHKLLSRLSEEDLSLRGFDDDEREGLSSLYYALD